MDKGRMGTTSGIALQDCEGGPADGMSSGTVPGTALVARQCQASASPGQRVFQSDRLRATL